MPPPDYRWQSIDRGEALYLHGVQERPYRCASFSPLPGGGILLRWGVRDCIPNQRAFATPAGAMRFAEAWAAKWDPEIMSIVANKGRGYQVGVAGPEVLAQAARDDYRRRHSRRKDWFKQTERPLN